MNWLLGALVVAVLGAVVVVASGRGGGYPDTEVDRPGRLPQGPLGPADLRAVRFSVTLRGYRQVEVDALLARLAEQWEGEGPRPDARGDGAGSPPVEP
ncbi:MAG: DivIVA domain-containing protein [Nocardioides sp.]|uniref:DivIVA domain-containing protein n=1 Tax=Nocardioides sp. TaxID=35761 RepID=UPI003F00350C